MDIFKDGYSQEEEHFRKKEQESLEKLKQKKFGIQPYTVLLDKHDGLPAYVFGAGPSLFELHQNGSISQILHLAERGIVIFVNSAFLICPKDAGSSERYYWISNDALVRQWSYWTEVKKALAEGRMQCVVRDSWKKYEEELAGFMYFWPRPTSESIINPNDEGLSYCSSVPSAIDLALQMGCKTIHLFGVDQYRKKGKSHFWQFLPQEEQPVRVSGRLAAWAEQTTAFKYNDQAYPALKDFADYKKATIINYSLDSKVVDFEKRSIETLLK